MSADGDDRQDGREDLEDGKAQDEGQLGGFHLRLRTRVAKGGQDPGGEEEHADDVEGGCQEAHSDDPRDPEVEG